jgi:hypothetical protein
MASLEGELKVRIASYEGEIRILTQKLDLATQQQKVASEEAQKFKAQLSEWSEAEPRIREKLKQAQEKVQQIIAANNAVASTLTFSGARVPEPLNQRITYHFPQVLPRST